MASVNKQIAMSIAASQAIEELNKKTKTAKKSKKSKNKGRK